MDSNRYSYLWENNDNVLVKSKYGYSIVDRKKCKMFLIENEKIEAEIIQNMLRNGRPIYKSIEKNFSFKKTTTTNVFKKR